MRFRAYIIMTANSWKSVHRAEYHHSNEINESDHGQDQLPGLFQKDQHRS